MLWWPISTLHDYWKTESERRTDNAPVSVPTARDASAKQGEEHPLFPDSDLTGRLTRMVENVARLNSKDISISVWDLTCQSEVFTWQDKELMVPASSLKILTAISALKRLGHRHRFFARMMVRGDVRDGVLYGDVIFQADDNPMVTALNDYVAALGRQGIRKVQGEFIVNLMRTDTLKAHPTASRWDIPYNKTPILLKGAPRIAREMSALLRNAGIAAPSPTLHEGLRPYPGAREIKRTDTPLTDIISPMLIHSSNILADALAYHVRHYADRYSTGIGEREDACEVFLRENLHYDITSFTLNDGSGLSPQNQVTADFLIALLRYAWTQPEMKRYFLSEALATPGHPVRRGSLTYRMGGPVFQGRIFCKTGTLTSIGASSLCGYAHNANGRWYAFAIIHRNSPVGECRLYQDMLCRELLR